MRTKFTIGILLYGDFPYLADRCLRSIANTIKSADLNLRVGLNEVSPAVVSWVKSWVPNDCILEFDKNINKYPLMRQMVHGVKPIDTEYFMWFDDDSYLDGYSLLDTIKRPYWLQLVDHAMVNSDMIGSIYTMPFQGNQQEWVKAQPWYTGQKLSSKMKFATGGWWTIRTDLLYRFDYPWRELNHNGGDALLGELCHQQHLRLHNFRDGVKINADEHGRESKAERRGTDHRSRPLGWDYDPGVAATLNRATTQSIVKL